MNNAYKPTTPLTSTPVLGGNTSISPVLRDRFSINQIAQLTNNN